MPRLLKFILLFFVFCAVSKAQDAQLEEIVVTGARSSESAPVVISVKGDFHLQPIRLINDSLVTSERSRDVKEAFSAIVKQSLKSNSISVVRSRGNLRPIKDIDEFTEWFVDSEKSRKGYLDLMLKSEIKKHKPEQGTYSEVYEKFLVSIGEFGRTKTIFNGGSDITILDPRQYRGQLIKAIGKDIQTLTQALGGKYGATIQGLDNEVKWHRVGEDNVEFYIPYSFIVFPETIRSIPQDY